MYAKHKTAILVGGISILIIMIVCLLTTSVSSAASVLPFVGNWIGTHRDGSELSLTIGGGPSGPFNITITDDNMTFCGGPGINQGIGMLNPQDPNLVEANMSLLCTKTGERYDNYLTAVYNPTQDTLLVNSGISFHRASSHPRECVPAPSRLSGWWPGDGNANDLISGNNGEFKGDATTTKGLVDQAFKLDGDGDYIEVPDNPVLNFGTNQFTIDLWVNFENLDGQQVLAEKWINFPLSTGWTLHQVEKSLYFTWGDGYGQEDALGVDIPGVRPHIWYHIAVARYDQFVLLYLNGTAIAGKSYPAPLNLDSPTSLLLGRRGDDGGFYLNGLIDEVEIYNGTALTQEQVFEIYTAGHFGKCKDYINGPGIRAHPVTDVVDAWWWPEDKMLTLTVDDPNTRKSPDIRMLKSGEDIFAGTVWFYLAGYDLKPGDIVTLTDGVVTKTLTISNVTITSVDIEENKMYGTADPGIWVRLPVPTEIFAQADEFGNWTGDFSGTGYQLQPGTMMLAEEFDIDGDLTMFEYWIPEGQ